MAFTRICGLAAIGFAVLLLSNGAILAPAGMPVVGAEPAEVRAFFSAKGGIVELASVSLPMIWVLLTLFGAGAVVTLRRSERDRGEAWSLVGFAGLVLQNATFAVIAAIRLALAATTTHDPGTAVLWAMHDALFTLNGTSLVLALVGLSIAGRRCGLIRPWHARLGLLAAALLATSATLTPLVIDHTGPLGLIALTGWLMWVAWIATYGLVLIRRPPAGNRHLPAGDVREGHAAAEVSATPHEGAR
ncbi:hypothetical protein Aph01nite_79400 [Acrocarpospora phusangensis]|uniref:DUF4386 domain-containing protein n=2 Tax=Acrocarpospora phusangensis TaxID=1070424 RepID=A0A919UVQ6_9ACTN|nr:hypothetical protein Aph01nite_79400 [Acrocarpospora phusangensis]